MKKTFRIIALLLSVAMLVGTMCGCSAFMEGFMEGYNSAMNSTDDSSSSGEDESDPFAFDDSGEEDNSDEEDDTDVYTEDDAMDIFASNIGDYTAEDLLGSWTDSEGDSLVFAEDGTVDWFGNGTYDKFEVDGDFCVFYDGDESYKSLVRIYGDVLVVYNDPFYYGKVAGDSEATDPLIGRWESIDGEDYAFEFFENGVFTEDDEYEGKYYIEDNDMILCYDDGDISFGIFVIEDDKLGYAFGWPMSRD